MLVLALTHQNQLMVLWVGGASAGSFIALLIEVQLFAGLLVEAPIAVLADPAVDQDAPSRAGCLTLLKSFFLALVFAVYTAQILNDFTVYKVAAAEVTALIRAACIFHINGKLMAGGIFNILLGDNNIRQRLAAIIGLFFCKILSADGALKAGLGIAISNAGCRCFLMADSNRVLAAFRRRSLGNGCAVLIRVELTASNAVVDIIVSGNMDFLHHLRIFVVSGNHKVILSFGCIRCILSLKALAAFFVCALIVSLTTGGRAECRNCINRL